MINTVTQWLTVLLIFLLPLAAHAQSGGGDGVSLAREFVGKINEAILFPLISLLIGIAVLVFLYGAYEYVAGSDNDSEREKGKQHLLWGTVGLLVMVSAMGILTIAANTFGLGDELEDARPNTRSR